MSHGKSTIRQLLVLVILLAVSGVVGAAGTGGGAGGIPAGESRKARTPDQVATSEYKSGLRQKQKALGALERAGQASSEKQRARFESRADKAFGKAIAHYKKVLQVDPRHYQAANELGFALRKTGDFQSAVGAYNYALKLKPDFLEAIEYRGEALLALGYLEEAKQAYIHLYRHEPALAAQLMSAMAQWVEAKSGSGNPLAEDERGFVDWVRQRARLVSFSSAPDATGNSSRW